MKDIVIHVQDSVCAANNRDPEAAALIEAARSFGTVESLDNALAQERARFQAEIIRLTAQHKKEQEELTSKLQMLQDHNLTKEEVELLQAIRKKAQSEAAHYEAEIQSRDNQLEAVAAECEARRHQIKDLFGF